MSLWQIEPLGEWGRPVTASRASSGRFRANWDDTLSLLLREVEHLQIVGAVAVRVDADAADIRRDGMLRARASVDFPGVVVSFESALHGPLSYATDAYEQRWRNDLTGWQANVRAIALSLEALRAVDRYGVTRSGEQYVGWRAIEAAPAATSFASADEALRWMRAEDGDPAFDRALSPRQLYKHLAARFHPDAGGDPQQWTRLDDARQVLAAAGLLL